MLVYRLGGLFQTLLWWVETLRSWKQSSHWQQTYGNNDSMFCWKWCILRYIVTTWVWCLLGLNVTLFRYINNCYLSVCINCSLLNLSLTGHAISARIMIDIIWTIVLIKIRRFTKTTFFYYKCSTESFNQENVIWFVNELWFGEIVFFHLLVLTRLHITRIHV
jgi:hypothetical protein